MNKDISKKINEPWIQTFTGQKFWLNNPLFENIKIEDIAHSLSMICRYNGHSKFFYSVAQHSFMASFLCPDHLRLAVLLHDASEAYIGDVTKPLKHYIGGKYQHMETKIQNAIYLKYRLKLTAQDILEIIKADSQMLKFEAENVLSKKPIDDWHNDLPVQKYFQYLDEGWSPGYAKEAFLDRFSQLFKEN